MDTLSIEDYTNEHTIIEKSQYNDRWMEKRIGKMSIEEEENREKKCNKILENACGNCL